MGKVLITDTILRDAHQSQAATRMRLEEMLPVADKLDKMKYWTKSATILWSAGAARRSTPACAF